MNIGPTSTKGKNIVPNLKKNSKEVQILKET
jgi:hypothetical protein